MEKKTNVHYYSTMDPNDANTRIQMPNAPLEPASATPAAFTTFQPDGNGATLDVMSLLLTGDRASGELLSKLNGGAPRDCRIEPEIVIFLPASMIVPTWDDPYQFDPFGRSNLHYWTARALEAGFDAPGSAMGVMPTAVCTLGKDGKPGQCCDPTSDPFPSKPYFYKIPNGKSPSDVAHDFGRNDNGWIELRRANADDKDGFVKMPNGWCYWKVWEEGKVIRIPGSWPESEFTAAVFPHLVDGRGYQFQLSDLAGSARLFMTGMPWKWRTPTHMLIECGKGLWSDPSVHPGLEVDPIIGKQILMRSFKIV